MACSIGMDEAAGRIEEERRGSDTLERVSVIGRAATFADFSSGDMTAWTTPRGYPYSQIESGEIPRRQWYRR